jgi:hypothetical protein
LFWCVLILVCHLSIHFYRLQKEVDFGRDAWIQILTLTQYYSPNFWTHNIPFCTKIQGHIIDQAKHVHWKRKDEEHVNDWNLSPLGL